MASGFSTTRHPLDLLADYEQRARDSAVSIPKIEEVRQVWFGIGFQISGQRLTVPAQEVHELMNYPRTHRVPGVRGWIRGLANVRGRILTIVDLGSFLMGELTAVRPRSRLLALKDDNLQAGFLVDEVVGLKHFFEDDYTDATDGFADWLAPFLSGQFRERDNNWGVLNLDAVRNSPDFLQAEA